MTRMLQVLFLVVAAAVCAGSPLDEAVKAYQYNEPVKARALFEEALAAEPSNPRIYYWLGIVYRQLGDPEKAAAVLQRGLPVAGDLRAQFYHSLGQCYSTTGDQQQAEKMYGEAIAADQGFASPWIDRANSRVRLEKYQGAIADYTMYLRLAPDSRQKPAVERMIALLSESTQKQEAVERDRKERERALMEQVLNALKNASEDARNLSTKSDRVYQEKEEEIDVKP
jgi:tetratricopeptide (TPR) repeat protein